MSRLDAPEWAVQSFARSASAAGASAPRSELVAACAEFVDLWTTPERHFHTIVHVYDVLGRVDQLGSEAANTDLVRLATWGHGCVFSAAGENREASAQVSADIFESIGISAESVAAISELIRGLRAHPLADSEVGRFDPADMNRLVFSDAHLGLLAAEPQKYRTYLAEIRKEHADIPTREFHAARLQVVTHLLQRRRLFRTPLAGAWEEPARQNLESEKARLDAELTEPATGVGAGGAGGGDGAGSDTGVGTEYGGTGSDAGISGGDDGSASESVGGSTGSGAGSGTGAGESGGDGGASGTGPDGSGGDRTDVVGTSPGGARVRPTANVGERVSVSTAGRNPGEASTGARDKRDPRTGVVAPSQAAHGGSSLEMPADHIDPGVPKRTLTPEEAKQARRDSIAQLARDKSESAGNSRPAATSAPWELHLGDSPFAGEPGSHEELR